MLEKWWGEALEDMSTLNKYFFPCMHVTHISCDLHKSNCHPVYQYSKAWIFHQQSKKHKGIITHTFDRYKVLPLKILPCKPEFHQRQHFCFCTYSHQHIPYLERAQAPKSSAEST